MATVFPTLGRIEQPFGARAAAQQLRERTAIAFPSGGFRDRTLQPSGAPRLTTRPHHDSAMWFKQLACGHRTGNGLLYAVKATQVRHLLLAENVELRAARDHAGQGGIDGSLAPRRMALWVQVSPACVDTPFGDSVLDAMAHWATYRHKDGDPVLARCMRTTVVGGSDATALNDMLVADGQEPVRAECEWVYRITVRWVDDGGVQRGETVQYNHTLSSADALIGEVQQTLVRLCGTHGAPFPKALMRPVARACPHNAFALMVVALDKEFETLVVGTPHVEKSDAAKHEQAAPLEKTSVVVRLCPKDHGEAGITKDSAFHGVLLSFGESVQDAMGFALNSVATNKGVLNVPLGAEGAMGLHVCAVQAEDVPLHDRVSLYGTAGKPGEPIHPPNSWVWLESAAVMPIDARLQGKFDVRPCSKESVLPGYAALSSAYKEHFKHVSSLYLALADRATNISKCPTTDSFSSEETDVPFAIERDLDDDEDDATHSNERFMLAALRVDLQSTRTTIGDAYAYLFEVGPPTSVMTMLLQAAGRLGVGASLSSALTLCHQSIAAQNCSLPRSDSHERLKRLADCALNALVADEPPDAKRAKPPPPPPPVRVSSNKRIHRMLCTLDLKKGNHAQIKAPPKIEQAHKALDVVAQALRLDADLRPGQANDALWMGVKQANENDIRWITDLEYAVAKAVAALLVAAHGAGEGLPCDGLSVFLLASRTGTDEVRVSEVTRGAAVRPSSFDRMLAIDAKELAVIIVQTQGDLRARITATVPTTPAEPKDGK